ncbi:uncharacterized protein LOC122021643 isoform X3 [Zingiber officinale]|uniref:uncharacterized protein LOC122021643 isoform X3 n=1 Tax=Zingiber officinale TaxID=94328 RepID=UPI001C4D3C10|nr:uncharacterized protein LOC122021643 isoform X3 [Zingiber officinale]
MFVNDSESIVGSGSLSGGAINMCETKDEVGRQISDDNVINDARCEEDSSSVVRRRGPNHGSQIPTNIDERTQINVVMNKFVENEVPREITNDIKGVIKGVWPTWKKLRYN